MSYLMTQHTCNFIFYKIQPDSPCNVAITGFQTFLAHTSIELILKQQNVLNQNTYYTEIKMTVHACTVC